MPSLPGIALIPHTWPCQAIFQEAYLMDRVYTGIKVWIFQGKKMLSYSTAVLGGCHFFFGFEHTTGFVFIFSFPEMSLA
jgi:hypothetical protein